jgi:hypothetical protein
MDCAPKCSDHSIANISTAKECTEYVKSVEGSQNMSSWSVVCSRLRLKCDGTRAETRFRLSTKRTSPLKSAGVSVHSTTGSRGMHLSGSNAGYTMFRVTVKSTGYPLHLPVSPSLPLPCITVCHHISAGVYCIFPLVVRETWVKGHIIFHNTSVIIFCKQFDDFCTVLFGMSKWFAGDKLAMN